MASNQYQVPELLLEAFSHNRVVLFVGAGPSIAASLPSWQQLLEGIARGAGLSPEVYESVVQHLEHEHFLDVADYLRDVLHRGDFHRLVDRQLGQDNIQPVKIHSILMDLPTCGVITTNYDRLLDRADVNRRLGTPFTWRDPALAQRLGKAFLFHAHGSLDDPDSLIIAARDYERLTSSEADHYREFLRNVFSPPYRVLFVGFGFRDPDLNLLLTQVRQSWRDWHNPPYALMEVTDPLRPDRVNESKLRRLGLQPILIAEGSSRGAATQAWLDAIRDLVKNSAAVEGWTGLPPHLREGLARVLEEIVDKSPDVLENIQSVESIGPPSAWKQNVSWAEDYVVRVETRGAEKSWELVQILLKHRPDNAILRNVATYLPPP